MFSFVDKYMILKKLRKMTEYKVYDSYSNRAYSSKLFRTIFLPITPELSINELKLLLKREEAKIKRKVETFKDSSYEGINDIAFDVLNNMIYNIIPSTRKKLVKKLSPIHLLDVWEYYDINEKKSVITLLRNMKIITDEKEINEIIEIIDKTFESAKSYNSAEDFALDNTTMFKNFAKLFIKHEEVGDGHAPQKSSFSEPDWGMVFEIRKIIRNLKAPTYITEKEIKFTGKRLNNKYIFDMSIYPFENKVEKQKINKPNIGIIIDFSGSMDGTPEINAKTFAAALIQENICNEILVKNEYMEEIVSTVPQLRSKPTTGDEGFEEFIYKDYIKDKDLIIVITDLKIAHNEMTGLRDFISDKNTIILVVSNKNLNEYKEELPYRRYKFSDKDDLIVVAKKLTKSLK